MNNPKEHIIKLKKKQDEIIKDQSRFKLVFAGRRGAKTTTGAVETAMKLQKPYQNIAAISPTEKQVKRDVWKALNFVIPEDWIKRKYLSSPRRIELVNGSLVTLYSGGSAESIRGDGLNHAWVDEIKDQPRELWYEILRPALAVEKGSAFLGGTPFYSEFVLELNSDPTFKKFSYTTLQGGYVDQEEIELAMQSMDERSFKQEFEARIEAPTGLVYYAYTQDNYSNLEIDQFNDLYLCFDFNVNPMTCTLNQNKGNDYFAAVKEFVLKNSNTFEICKVINNYLEREVNFSGRLEVTGDKTGMRQQTSGGGRSDWTIIEDAFRNWPGYRKQLRTVKNVNDRVNALNSMFKSYSGEIRQVVNTNLCPNLHRDLTRQIRKDDGRLDDMNGTIGHSSDNLSYHSYNYYPLKSDIKTKAIGG